MRDSTFRTGPGTESFSEHGPGLAPATVHSDHFIYALLSFPSVPAVGGLKFSMAQKKLQKVPVGGSASWGKCHFGEVPVGEL